MMMMMMMMMTMMIVVVVVVVFTYVPVTENGQSEGNPKAPRHLLDCLRR